MIAPHSGTKHIHTVAPLVGLSVCIKQKLRDLTEESFPGSPRKASILSQYPCSELNKGAEELTPLTRHTQLTPGWRFTDVLQVLGERSHGNILVCKTNLTNP